MYGLCSFENGFEYLDISNAAAHAKITLQGAHIFEYLAQGRESLLWLSDESSFKEGVAIRGGIPLCWPRFGNLDKTLPQHGFARVMLFELISVEEPTPKLTEVHLQLKSSIQSREVWDYEFVLDVVFRISEKLTISMTTHNCDSREFLLTQAFHSYFQVSDIANVTICGLEGISFLDTLREKRYVENKPIIIESEIDRVYEGAIGKIFLCDGKRRVEILAENSASAIVWNPWIEKCSQMSGMKNEAYKEFVCIESANAFDDFKTLQAGQKDTITVHYQEV
ncbi:MULTISPECIES: D-hexose-6-phosphate mutarotase [Sulfurimonas]|uniref:D-hexose-6-phosphate mutarotase n=1 Tax=Sulfurimonas TaxID=202746 RepID=UPI001264B04D|nr:D-hexose-6-phosphate mutarotase [Sulfurimonas indica]